MLNNITSKLYDIINETREIETKKCIFDFKNMIDDYYKNKDDIHIGIIDKKMYYDTYYNNPRIIQDELYNEYYIQRKEIYDELLSNYDIINIKKLAKFTKFNYDIIEDIYTYNIEVNKNFKKFTSKKENNNEKIKIKNYINENIEKNDADFEIEEEEVKKYEEKKELNDIRKEKIEDKCTDKKIKECKEKGKVCNPDSGRCVAKLKQNVKEKFDKQIQAKEEDVKKDIKEDITEDITEDKCTDKKIKECKEKGKVCNPDSGRCVAKLKQNVKEKFDKQNQAKEEDVKKDVKEDITEDIKEDIKKDIKEDKCTDKKIKECKEKGKVCNPDSGRCVAKLKK
jgi:hypothetical protein